MSMPLTKAIEEYIKFRGWRISTKHARRSYLLAERKFSQCMGRETTLDDINSENANALVSWMLENDYKPATVTSYANVLNTIWRWACKTGLYVTKPSLLAIARPANEIASFKVAGTEIPGDSGPIRLDALIADMASIRGWTAATIQHYKAIAAAIEKWAGRAVFAHEFNREWVNRHIEETEATMTSATARTRRVHLLSLWRFAWDEGLCKEPPVKVRRVRLVQKPPEAWSVAEVNRLVSQAAKVDGCYGSGGLRIARSIVWRLVIRILWDTGLRPGDAMRLAKSDVDVDGICQLVQGKVGRWHVCRLHPSTMAILAEVRSTRMPLIPWHASVELLRRDFHDRVLDSTGLVGHLKKLRKSSASDVELNYPGMGGIHLGHQMAGNIAHCHYLDPRIVAKNRPMPTELTGDVTEGGAL